MCRALPWPHAGARPHTLEELPPDLGTAGLFLAGSGHGPMPPWHRATAVVELPLWERKGGADGEEEGDGADLHVDPAGLRLDATNLLLCLPAATAGLPTRCTRLHHLRREEKEKREERESPVRAPACGFA